jgi:hypothetical protein
MIAEIFFVSLWGVGSTSHNYLGTPLAIRESGSQGPQTTYKAGRVNIMYNVSEKYTYYQIQESNFILHINTNWICAEFSGNVLCKVGESFYLFLQYWGLNLGTSP